MASYKDIIKYYQKYWLIAVLSITVASIFEILDLIVPYIIGQILSILSNKNLDLPIQQLISKLAEIFQTSASPTFALGILLLIIFVVAVLRAPAQPWLSNWFHWAIPLQARCEQSEAVIKKLLTLPLEFYEDHNPGRIAGRVSRGISNHTWTYPEVAGQVIPKLIKILGIFFVIFIFERFIAVIFLISFFIILFFSFRNLQILIKREDSLDKYIEGTESRTSEIITNIKTVKSFATEGYELNRQKQRLHREKRIILERIHRGYVKLASLQRTMVQFCLFFILSLTLFLTLKNQITLGHFITVFTISSMAYSEIEPLSTVAESISRRYASMIRFHEFMQEISDKNEIDLSAKRTDSIYKYRGKIEFINVYFGYHEHQPILKKIDLTIEPCQMVALVGRSGAGKSTLVKLLFRCFDPDSGNILIDDQDIRLMQTSDYLKRLSIVHQEVDLFNGTLLENLMYGNPNASLKQVKDACSIAQVDEFIAMLPQGYHTFVGERGIRLSGGQRQRLGIARALLTEPDVLVFDEATSNLDYESEHAIQKAMRSLCGTRTVLVIAHRLSTVRYADKIVVLDQGEIKEEGKHEELLKNKGLYWKLNLYHEVK